MAVKKVDEIVPAPKTIAEAILKIQKDSPTLQKNAINPHFKNRYITLESLLDTILPLLNEQELVLLQQPTYIESTGGPALTTMLIHTISGEELAATMPLVLDRENPQGQGSAITYARRYSLMALLGLVADEDDDANQASPRRSTGTAVQGDPSANYV